MWDNALRLAIWKYVWEFSYFNLTPTSLKLKSVGIGKTPEL